MRKLAVLFSLFLLSIVIYSCGEKNSDFVPKETIKDYFPVEVGKFITYRIDSTVFVRSGSVIEIHKYQVRHTVTGTTKDNLSNDVFTVDRELRNAEGTDNWKANGRYYITVNENSVEVNEDNLKVTKLVNPITMGTTWKGNSKLPLIPYATVYETEAGKEMNTWNFSLYNFGDTTVENNSYTNVWSVQQNNYVLNIPVTPNTQIGLKEVGFEKYAKNIGLVYKNLEIYDFQGKNNTDNPQDTYSGFGIKMWMIDHN